MKKLSIGILLAGLGMIVLGCRQQKAQTNEPAYTVETIETPEGLSVETGGVDFLPDGRLIACFRRGEVMTYNPADSSWSLFAKGLQDPLGIKAVSNTEVLVMQRPELTRLIDTDGDSRADRYKTVTDDFGMSGNYHEFAFGPAVDSKGNYYIALNVASNGAGIRDILRGKFNPLGRPGRMYSTVPYRGWILKVTPDGKTIPWASGLRSPNGLVFNNEGELFVPDNQGDWLGTNKLYHIEKGKFYGHPSSLVWEEGFDMDPLKLPVSALNLMRTRAAVLFPHGFFVNSPTQPVIDRTGGKFGPFRGQMFLGEMNHQRIVRVMLEKVQGRYQGAAVSFIDSTGLRIGNNRLAFSPSGDLWVGQTDHGWPGDQGIQTISWNGVVPMEVKTMSLTPEGFELTFTKPVAARAAGNPENYHVERYYYKYSRPYGSDRYGIKTIDVRAASVSDNGKKVNITLSELDTGYIYDLTINNVASQQGDTLVHNRLYYTLNYLQDH